MAANLLIEDRREPSLPLVQPPPGSGTPSQRLSPGSQNFLVAVLLFLLTVAAVIFAGFNFQKERESVAPDDGIGWIEGGGKLVADRVEPPGPGAKGGIKQ